MANTVIQLKYSDLTNTPGSLATGEAAYSNTSDTLFIGLSDGSIVNVGGVYYTSQIDNATSQDTPSTIVERDADGNFTANVITATTIVANITGTIEGVASSANKWETARDLGLAGDATGNVTIDGTENETLTVTLADTGVGATTYGNTTNIPQITVDSKGRITSASNVEVSIPSTLSLTGDSGSDTVNLNSGTLNFEGGDGVTTTVTDDQVSIAVDNTVVRTTGAQSVEDLSVTGNLTVTGQTTYANTTTVNLGDNIITLNADIPQDAAPSEDAGIEIDRGTSANVSLLWNETSDKWTFTNNGSDYFPIADGDRLDSAFGAANTAQTTADGAFTAANTAQSTADGAFSAANTAQSTADGAFSAANTAQTTASAAFDQANTATSDASTAQTTADAAFGAANTAQSTADGAFTAANTAQTTASAAFDQANTATSDASTAQTTADAAFGAANTAQTTASAAFDQANTATSDASTAQTTADAAFGAANTAQTTADGAYDHANGAFDLANTSLQTSGGTISGDLAITGNLLVSGNTTTYDVDNYIVNDPIVVYANNNTDNVLDIGFVGRYVEAATEKHTGLVRDVSTNSWYLFENYEPHVEDDHTLNIADPTLVTSNLVANLTGGTVSGLTSDIAVADGGTGAGSFTTGAILIGNGTGALQELSNSTYTLTGGLATSNTISSLTVDAYGRVTAATGAEIAIAASQVTSGTFSVSQGGTGATTLTNNGILLGQGTSAISSVSSSTEGHVLQINDSGVPTFAHLNGGSF